MPQAARRPDRSLQRAADEIKKLAARHFAVAVPGGRWGVAMTDYDGFWQGFVFLFAGLPVIAGAILGMLWGWRKGKRDVGLVLWAMLGAAILSALALAAAAFFFRG